ncbi:hypothetical protein V2J79_05130 [Pseudomonas alliivorans]|nr:hypothetical protein [Pseudomonas alliivorans]
MSKEYKLVPASMLLDKTTIGAILFHCGDGSGVDLEECSEGLLWIGDVTDDDGKTVHGLHISTAEYPEEGSTTLVEFAAPQPPALGGEAGAIIGSLERFESDGEDFVKLHDVRDVMQVVIAPLQAENKRLELIVAQYDHDTDHLCRERDQLKSRNVDLERLLARIRGKRAACLSSYWFDEIDAALSKPAGSEQV